MCRQLPSIFTPIIAPLIMNWSGAMKKVRTSIRQVVERRMREIDPAPHSLPKCKIDRLTQQVGALFFASSHQIRMALVYAIYSLCTHPEYVEPLRSEIMDMIHPESNGYFPNDEQRQLRKEFRTKYTDVSAQCPYWESTKKPCPRRWYVSDTLKLALVHLIMNYEVKLADEETPRSFFWTAALVPRLSTRILVRKREHTEYTKE
ncbi:hypothetical protein K505DRAFT_332425 [Melanomma pulvis-pyrius CBS 109.77]|uniref:Cytochrome P450 n=1 Tax=Melanomma pulvis-pyrius CBS 109.77 TaxID=1314802 RepID=A0A6A6XT40_9PLEO|nr:hypothetical protein K505DRAFT_332425 [Melanomma pulvis-pyrius CBS 109.77]